MIASFWCQDVNYDSIMSLLHHIYLKCISINVCIDLSHLLCTCILSQIGTHVEDTDDKTWKRRINENSLQHKIVTNQKYLQANAFILAGKLWADPWLLSILLNISSCNKNYDNNVPLVKWKRRKYLLNSTSKWQLGIPVSGRFKKVFIYRKPACLNFSLRNQSHFLKKSLEMWCQLSLIRNRSLVWAPHIAPVTAISPLKGHPWLVCYHWLFTLIGVLHLIVHPDLCATSDCHLIGVLHLIVHLWLVCYLQLFTLIGVLHLIIHPDLCATSDCHLIGVLHLIAHADWCATSDCSPWLVYYFWLSSDWCYFWLFMLIGVLHLIVHVHWCATSDCSPWLVCYFWLFICDWCPTSNCNARDVHH